MSQQKLNNYKNIRFKKIIGTNDLDSYIDILLT